VAEKIQSLADELRPSDSKSVEGDLADEPSVVNCAKAIVCSEKRIDGLVNCAGIAHGSLFSMTNLDHLQHVFQVNLFS
jgi:3-oxoacyl-[acyl-carrier protein] reductase